MCKTGIKSKLATDIRSILLAGVAMSLSAIPAAAQEESDIDSLLALEEIVVTAQRRAQSLQDTALALEVFDDEAFKNAGITTASDLTKLVPGLQIGLSGPAPQVFLSFSPWCGRFRDNLSQ